MWKNDISSLCARQGVPAAVVALGEHGSTVDHTAYGVCDIGSGVAVTEDTAFGVASVSKSVTALAVMQLVADGRMSLDDGVSKYIPEIGDLEIIRGGEVRVRDLLTHTAGLPPLATRFAVLSAGGDSLAPQCPEWVQCGSDRISSLEHLFDYWRSLRGVRPLSSPGSIFSYSNEGYVLAGLIVERLSGQRFSDYVQAHIFEPLGMSRSTYGISSYVGAGSWAVYHTSRREEPMSMKRAPARYYEPLWYPAGGLHTTANDLIRYLRIFDNSRPTGDEGVLPLRFAQEMLVPVSSTLPGIGYGGGLWLGRVGGERYAYHSGSGKGISAYVGFFPASGRACAVVSNVSGAPVEQMATIAMRGRHGVDLTEVNDEWRYESIASMQPRASIRGTYRNDEGALVTIADTVVIAGEPVELVSTLASGIVVRGRQGVELIGYCDAIKPELAITYKGRVLSRVC